MTHEHIGGNLLTGMVASALGLLEWLASSDTVNAVLVAAACGVVGGFMRPFGTRIHHWLAAKWNQRKEKDQ